MAQPPPNHHHAQAVEQIRNTRFELLKTGLTDRSQPFFDALKEQYVNGGYQVYKFAVSQHPLRFGIIGSPEWLIQVLNHAQLVPLIPGLQPFEEPYQFQDRPVAASNLYSLLGDLCGILSQGGAYTSGSERPDGALIRITKDFIDELLPRGFRDYHCYRTFEAWNGWFFNIAWDYTALVVSKDGLELNLICLTDSD